MIIARSNRKIKKKGKTSLEGVGAVEAWWQGILPERGNQLLFLFAFSGLILLLFYPPFFRGLFFPGEQRWTLALASLLVFLTLCWQFSAGQGRFLSHPMDYAALALVLVYGLAALRPASYDLALNGLAKVILYFFTFWLVSRLAGGKRTSIILHTLYFSAAGVALAALLSATEIIQVKDSFLGGRFYSTLQYPNALASFVGAALILGLYLWVRSPRWRGLAYAVFNYLLLMVFIGTGSRGGFLVFPPVLLLYLALSPRSYRSQTLLHLLLITPAALLACSRFIPLAEAKAFTMAWGWFGLGILLVLAGELLLRFLETRASALARWVLGLLLILLFLGGGAFYLWHQKAAAPASSSGDLGVWSRVLPPQVAQRLKDFSLETKSSRERLIWTGDALKMIKDRPILGFGGGGWEAAYRGYQSYFYNSTQVHNDYAQVAVETGLLGLGILAVFWSLFFFYGTKLYLHAKGGDRLEALSLLLAALTIGLHAAIDFDLALGAVSMMLWALFGLVRSRVQEIWGRTYAPRRGELMAVGVLCGVLIVWSLLYVAGEASAREAAAAYSQGDLARATRHMREACLYNPFSATYRADLGLILLQQGKEEEALNWARRAVQLDPYNLNVLGNLASIYWKTGQGEEAIKTMEEARTKAPWVGAIWESLGRMYVESGIQYLRSGEKDKARCRFQEMLSLYQEAESRMALLEKYKDLHQPKGLRLSPEMQLLWGISHYFLGDEVKAAKGFEAAAKEASLAQEARMWQALLAHRQGDHEKAKRLMEELKGDPRWAQLYASLKDLSL